MRHAADRQTPTGIPRVAIIKGTATTGLLSGLYAPMLCLVVQGAKSVMIGDQVLHYDTGRYFISSVEVPATGRVVEATPERPYLAISLTFDPAVIASILLDMPPAEEAPLSQGFGVSQATGDMIDAWSRMLNLMERPAEIAVLGPLVEREIVFRLLQGPEGPMLRQIAIADSRLSQIRKALTWIRTNYMQAIRVADLAKVAGMSVTVFHRHFKAVTAMTPIQYQKQFRLYEARRRLFAAPGDAAGAAFAVGYESASQFSRDYSRLFGVPPARDIRRLRSSRNTDRFRTEVHPPGDAGSVGTGLMTRRCDPAGA